MAIYCFLSIETEINENKKALFLVAFCAFYRISRVKYCVCYVSFNLLILNFKKSQIFVVFIFCK